MTKLTTENITVKCNQCKIPVRVHHTRINDIIMCVHCQNAKNRSMKQDNPSKRGKIMNERISIEAMTEINDCLQKLSTIVPVALHMRHEIDDDKLTQRLAEHAFQLRHLFQRIIHNEY